jgi:catechol 2,3-dioxygenase-like lactoylglutathione lyase family enzyme
MSCALGNAKLTSRQSSFHLLGNASMPIKSLDHIQLAMPAGREAEARAFYADLLGIPETPKPANLAKRGGCWFEGGAIKVHLGVDKDFRPASKAHPAFIVEDLASLIAGLAQAVHPARQDEPLPGYTRVFIDDPFGNRIELMQPLPE